MRQELFWDRKKRSPYIEIKRAINFGGFDYINMVIDKYGINAYKDVLMNSRGLSKKAVNYWCLILNIDRAKTKTFASNNEIWRPFR
jgi:hypothetical protein